jgi:hypothetical protein
VVDVEVVRVVEVDADVVDVALVLEIVVSVAVMVWVNEEAVTDANEAVFEDLEEAISGLPDSTNVACEPC